MAAKQEKLNKILGWIRSTVLLAVLLEMNYLAALDLRTYIQPQNSPCITDNVIVEKLADEIIDKRLSILPDEKVTVLPGKNISRHMHDYYGDVSIEKLLNTENHILQKVCFYDRIQPDYFYNGTFYSYPQAGLLNDDSTMIKISFLIPINNHDPKNNIDERTLRRLHQSPPYAKIEIVEREWNDYNEFDLDEFFSLTTNLTVLNSKQGLPILLSNGPVYDSYYQTVFALLTARQDFNVINNVDFYNWPIQIDDIPPQYFQLSKNFFSNEIFIEKRNENGKYTGYLCLQPKTDKYLHPELFVIISFFNISPGINPYSTKEGNLVISIINKRILNTTFRGNTYHELRGCK